MAEREKLYEVILDLETEMHALIWQGGGAALCKRGSGWKSIRTALGSNPLNMGMEQLQALGNGEEREAEMDQLPGAPVLFI